MEGRTRAVLWIEDLAPNSYYYNETDALLSAPPSLPILALVNSFFAIVLEANQVIVDERRASERYHFKLPMVVRWTNETAIGEAETESRDVSLRGVSFVLPQEVSSDSQVEILLTLPHEITMAGPVKVRCIGSIKRAEENEPGQVGMVALIERFEFLRGNEDADLAEQF